MIEFIRTHNELLAVSTSIITAVIWLLYLNLFYTSMRRGWRPEILLSRSAGSGCGARLFISNMGAEPIYITAIIADYEAGSERGSAYVTQRESTSSDDLQSASKATNEGPLGSGDYLDAGSFGDLMARMQSHGTTQIKPEAIERLTLTVAAQSGYSATISAGRKTYRVMRNGGETTFHPKTVSTRQLRGWMARRRLQKRLESDIADAACAEN